MATQPAVVPLWRGRDPLEWLLGALPLSEFLSERWECNPLIVKRGVPAYYDELLTFADVDAFMARNDIRYPYLRVVKDGRELPLVDYADDFVYGSNVFPGLLDTDKVFHHYAGGATLSFQIFQKCMEELSTFCNAFEARAGFQTQVNIFVTPPHSKGFTAHYDDHSFFILQIAGTKQWTLYNSPVELPLREWRRTASKPSDLKSEQVITLSAGDLLYLPKGYYHEARTLDDTSIHITLGIFPHMWITLFERLVSRMKDEVAFRRAPGWQLQQGTLAPVARAEFDQLLGRLSGIDPQSLLDELRFEAASKQIVDGTNRLRDLSELAAVSASTRFRRRAGIYCRLAEENESLQLRFYDKRLNFPLKAKPALEFVLNAESFVVGEMPRTLDDAGNLVVARKLLREGLLTIEAL